ncbi:hypothetical protein [Microbacterium sp. AG238]|uniref:hypothetical protein n=1 Tax=Microbacterium sp. AG238 TaxID=2183994 RepID=UPI0011C49F7F|nr:hypothetical protein [Microbacterium sp. AG238]
MSEAGRVPPVAWRGGFAVAVGDMALDRMGAPWFWEETTAATSTTRVWLSELREGLDVYARIVWCLRFGYTYAAAALARRYIERWTYNIAFSHEFERVPGSSDAQYLRDAWAHQPSHLVDRDVPADYGALSEFLHGRPAAMGSRTVAASLTPQSAERCHIDDFIARAAVVPLNQVRVCISLLGKEQGVSAKDLHSLLLCPISGFDDDVPEPSFFSVLYEPPDYDFVMSERSSTLTGWGQTYRRVIARHRDDESIDLRKFHAWMSLEERWARSGDEARRAFARERIVTGGAFDPAVLRAKLERFRAITELTDLLGVATRSQHRERAAALRAAAAAMESAWVLWLQDVDDSMTCVRGVIESVARARTHRLKPARARRMEMQRVAPSPSRWVDAAGWGRLSVFVRSLSELAHVQERSRHGSSRVLLTVLQENPYVPNAPQTARGHALEKVQMLIAHEAIASLAETHPQLAENFRARVVQETEAESEAAVSDWLARVFEAREFDFGPSDVARLKDE